ncbi:xyloglucan galactosyltransferase KATAMARI1 homolog [Phragmites australis]|uniref:xyloglucan galactosyltransferase KATAMARI1 homolog n=1 Tax=Phragmites australis TaxID=29695 RepID=UPI002D77AA65|nr:xyloglucan galactosyltransferase KATAMARI1 homolog [Phragmites australis]
MGSLRGSAVLRACRWLLPLAIPACCILWMLLVFASPPPELAVGRRESFHESVGEIVGAVERGAAYTPPASESEEIADMSLPPLEREEIIDTSPPLPECRARAETSPPPPPEPEQIIDVSPPPPERHAKIETPPPPPSSKHEKVIDASPPPPERQARTETPPSPPPLPQPARQEREARSEKPVAVADRCSGRYIYIQDLPSRFNADLLRDCRSLSDWTNMCKHIANAGMGPRLTRTGGVLPSTGWYDTNQFTLEVIFHNRMRQYGCLTADASLAAAVYVPYYPGLDVGRYLWRFSNNMRDALAEDLADWLRSSPAWAAHGGQDHFLVGGRIAWDFRREEGEWGSRLLLLPEARNMTALVLESSPWHSSDVVVPYPTYFHLSRSAEVASWQRAVRRSRRPWLFAFAGARRNDDGGLRDRLIDQCARSRRCGLLQCDRGRRNDCYAPGNVMRLFKSAAFCLQPPGDSYTRRSVFDAMLAGCVPVFFHPGSAYVQYRWHLPADHAKYSVFVPKDGVRNRTVQVEDVLRAFGAVQVAAMREQLVRMIPGIVYMDPRARAGRFRDAFDIAVDDVIQRVGRIKRGSTPWEEDDGEHRWNGYFDRRW